jgi:hypothetical protein
MNHQSMQNLLEMIEGDPAVRHGLEMSGARGKSQFVAAFQELGVRAGSVPSAADVEALIAAARAVQHDAPRELDDRDLDRVAGGGDDEQLANVDLQNMLQKQQQTLQMMSNVSKMLYDTAQSVIRKMGG